MDSNANNLMKLGLTNGEAKVYLALIELGSSTVGPIVSKSRVAYSNIYEILNRLVEKGLVSYIIKSKTKYFQAFPSSNIKDYLKKKRAEIDEQESLLSEILPKINELSEKTSKEEAEIFIGKKGLRTAYEKFLSSSGKNNEDLFFYIHEKEYAEESDLFYFSIIDIIKKVPSRGIGNEFYKKSEFIKKAKWIKMKTVDFPIPGNIEVCRDKMLLISWKKPIIAILIHSQSMADNFKNYFESVWKVARK
ncbi:hypothetical protein HY212_05875 [Candidatus Pacearchaeota archaeon]|nr:hypothetical protein [Candidatus Pacearchaeota archaeon]